jgi:hypothetical protein
MLAVFLGAGLLMLPELAVEFLFGQAVGALVHPLFVMYLGGLLGYNLALYAMGYKEAKCVALDEIVLS